ncbi:hypothetical protein [Pantoea anthophila]|uniref:hypothetical protein n=1 Tax=Pantoea anthophila TaxID=470931 RepID=UPI000614FA99|nr:hypothetical protein [Pantoea anthophila]KKB02726.1 hypothetical protein TN98_21040 [Pantoea anthophila]
MTIPTDSNSTANNAVALPETFNAGELTLNAGAAFSIPIAPAPLVITFCGTDGTRAQLTVNQGRVTFEGDPDAAAEMFIEAVTRKHAQQWGAQQAQLEEAEARLATYSHHNGLMMLSQRLVDVEKDRNVLRKKVNQSATVMSGLD